MPHDESTEPRGTETSLGIRYAAGLTFAHLLTATEVLAVVWSLASQTTGDTSALLTAANLIVVGAVVVLGTFIAGVGGYLNIAPSLRWYLAGVQPDAAQRRGAINLVRRQSALLLATWAVSGAVLILANLGSGPGTALLICYAVAFGSTSTFSTGLLFTQRTFRQVVAAATEDDFVIRQTAPGIASRLVMMWLVNSALPSATIVTLIVFKTNGWFIPTTTSLSVPVVILSVVAVLLGLRALILVARSIADPSATSSTRWPRWNAATSDVPSTCTNSPKSAGCKEVSTAWWPVSSSATGCGTCSGATWGPTS